MINNAEKHKNDLEGSGIIPFGAISSKAQTKALQMLLELHRLEPDKNERLSVLSAMLAICTLQQFENVLDSIEKIAVKK